MSENEITICSFNCQGLGGREKRKDVLNFLKQKNYSIYCLQDTHFTEKEENYIRSQWGYDCIFNSYNSQSRGTAILFNNNFEFKVVNVKKDKNGNKLFVEIEFEDKRFSLINIYGPNNDSPDFYDSIKNDLISANNDFIIWTGDFNLVMNPEKDTKNYININNPRSRDKVLDMCAEFNLMDIWRELNIESNRYTWRTNNGNKHGRLDFFLVSQNLFNNIKDANIEYGYKSDHSIINLTIKGQEIERDPPFWKFNNSLLKDQQYIEQIKNVIEETKIQYSEPNQNLNIENNKNIKLTVSEQIFFEVLLMNIRGKTISYSSHKKKQRDKKEHDLINEISKLEENEELNKQIIGEKVNELNEIRDNKLQGLMVRSRAIWLDKGEKVTKYFCNLENRNYISKLMPNLFKDDGSKTVSQTEIVNQTKKFYSKLYAEKETTDINLNEYFKDKTFTKLDEDQKHLIEGKIEIEEASEALKKMKNNRSPGSDGFTVEFFKFFWKDLKDFMIRAINFSYTNGELSNTQKEGLITCIPKGDKDKQLLKNWRPISLLNVTYKITSACIANRIKRFLPILIAEDQTGFIQGRFIGENTRKLYDLMHYTEHNNIPGLLLIIDFEKAFDSISWSFITKTLNFFNFGDSIIKWVNLFYKNIKSCVLVNGKVSEWFNISRGCRQGDPLSPYIFILCAEILALMIRNNKEIKGIKVGTEEHLISQYADDTTLTLDATEKSLKFALEVLQFYAEASGLHINIEKTKAVWFGSKKGSREKYFEEKNLCWENGKFRILGINFHVNLQDMNDLNYPDKIREIKSLLINWSKRVLTPFGKITVIKSLAVSKLNHLFLSLPNPSNNTLKELESIFFKFLWNNKPDKIKRSIITKNYEDGGLKMINVALFVESTKITWIRRLLKDNSKWINILEKSFPEVYHIFKYGPDFTQNKLRTIKNIFWKDVLSAWVKYNSILSIDTWEDFLSQPLWFNPAVKVGGKSVNYNTFINKNIIFISDLINERGEFITLEEARNSLEINTNFIQYNGLIGTLNRLKNDSHIEIKRHNIFRPIHPKTIRTITIEEKGSKNIYKSLIQCTITPKAENKWKTELNLGNDFDFKKIYQNIHRLTRDSNLKWFQYKIQHRLLATNKFLKQIGIRNEDHCSFCGRHTETFSHLFSDCETIESFWASTKNWLKTNLNQIEVTFSKTDIILGKTTSKDFIVNWIILLGKKYIYNNRCKNTSPEIHGFKQFLKMNFSIEKQVAFNNCEWDAFNNKWSQYKKLFEN